MPPSCLVGFSNQIISGKARYSLFADFNIRLFIKIYIKYTLRMLVPSCKRVMLRMYIFEQLFLLYEMNFPKFCHQINLPSKVEKGRVTLLTKLLVLLTLCAPHSFYHFFIQLHWRRKRLWISTQNISKVYVEEFAWMLTKNSFVSRIISKNW